MNRVLLKVEGTASVAEVLSVSRLEGGRSSIQLRCKRMVDRGRVCWVFAEAGRMLECIVSNATPADQVFVLDLRTVEDLGFLLKPESPGD